MRISRDLKSFGLPALPVLAFSTLVALSVYVAFRGLSFFGPGYRWLDRTFGMFLFASEAFLFFHTVGYLLSVARSSKSYRATRDHFFVSAAFQPVAVVVATYNEDPQILEETLASVSNLDYPGKRLYLLDDSTDPVLRERGEALARKYGWTRVHREQRRGYKAGALNDLLKKLDEKYMAVFDADQKPSPSFLDQTISLLEEDPGLAFVQTPQYYHNTERSTVAFGAAFQQVVFYEHICEGKSVRNAMFSCGSNVVYRVEALRSVGGFEEKSVTEDFATGLKLHLKGWKSLYYNHVSVYGLGPETLAAYYTQQMRWALGTLGLFKRIVALLLKKPSALTPGQWWEYFLSGSYYWVGWANFVLMVCPIVFLLFDVRPLIIELRFYLAAFVPYFAFSISTFYFSMLRRGYKARSLLVGQALSLNTFWVHMNAAVMALINARRPFGVTPKGKAEILRAKYLLPQILLIGASVLAIGFGAFKFTSNHSPAIIANMVWAGYHVLVLSTVFYLNRPVEPWTPRAVFVPAEVARA